MSQARAHHVRKDMASLGLCELLLSVLSIYTLLSFSEAALHRPIILPAAGIAIAIVALAAIMGLYRPRICLDPRQLLVTAIFTAVVASPVVFWVGGTSLGDLDAEKIVWLSKVLGVWFLVVFACRLIFGIIVRHGRLIRRVLVIAGSKRGAQLRGLLLRHHGPLFEPVLADPARVMPSILPLEDKHLWGIVIAEGALTAQVAERLLQGRPRGIAVFTEAGFQEQHLGRIDPATIGPDGLRASSNGMSETVKRLFDLVFSTALLMATLPLMVVTAFLIKLDSPGPVFYRQDRSGLHGKPFSLLKFRSMRADAEACGTPRWAQQRDPRVTRVGHFMRQTRIDELPQLLNVLRGDMSIIGPRPERPHFVQELARAIPSYQERAAVKPGITGWAQVNYPYGASVEDAWEKLAYDLYYVKNRSILLDIMILFSTVRVVLFREGAR